MASCNLRRRLGLVGLLLVLAVELRGAELPIDRGIGQRVANFTLKDVSGQPVSLYGFAGKKAVVLAFLGTDCPVGNLYAPRLAELSKAYQDKGVVFLGINSNAQETVEQVAAHAKTYGLDFPVLKDTVNLVADLTLAERTCEVLVLDGRAVLRYRGAIDDQYAIGKRKPAAANQYLSDALDQLLAGKPVATPATEVVGCLLDRLEAKPAATTTTSSRPRIRPASPEIVAALKEKEKETAATPVDVGQVTYAGHVAVVLRDRCQSCHRPGQVGPFSLLTYDDARRRAAMIREVVDDRRMPPWHADPRYGHFRNDRTLSDRERATLLAWVDQGAPLGDPAEIPAARSFPEEWTVGTPDVVFEIPAPYVVAAQGVLDYVKVRVPTHFTEDKWVQVAEAMPGDRSVVHHIIVYVDDHTKTGRERDAHLCGFAPGDMPSVFPPGTAKKIPAGSDLVFQLHYTPNGKIRTDRSKVGLTFAKTPVEHQARTVGVIQTRFIIPAEADNHPVRSSYKFPRDAHLLSFMPHMHLRGKSFQYEATFPDGRKQMLLSVPAYDFGWQTSYNLAEPLAMPKGTRIDCLAHYDNSKGNPANPDSTKAVTWGDQTFEEMMIGYLDCVDDGPITETPPAEKPANPEKAAAATQPSPASRLVRVLRALNSAQAGAN
ncbi:redoxin domain-containing protein [Singulisphaera acidiphila]|uniref:Peroxiredoxin n=1 Tax=Singulisphaera acidiphila (strain ATCC BAA-1392 / DSM 18658 / VKM B-2454 / MOB10) TaxID=886293 RepID=L0DK15_SINAD|nr:redoxin domain-containing protein [Singulisphaera acidiphila]AGA28981.1 Peroxiredoxin [Singulisphaera acidiphila DSM 18658]